VGPYGLLMRLPPQTAPEVITSETSEATPEELSVLATLKRAGVTLLSRATLDSEISLARSTDEGDVTRVYHALIGDDASLPWDLSG